MHRDWKSADIRDHGDVIADHISIDGQTILDVGCGNGNIARELATRGAKVTGIDPGARQLERARAEPVVGGEIYIEGTGENLAAEDASADAVVYFNSLHHVPLDLIDRAIDEARRVLRPGGALYIAEPLADGPMFEFQQPMNDETEVRAAAYDAIQRHKSNGFSEEAETIYISDRAIAGFEAWRDNSVAINPARAEKIAAQETALRRRFEKCGDKRTDGYHFPQPIRVNVLRKS